MDDLEIVKKHVAQLAEHFDTVRIFVTRHEGDKESTQAVTSGRGNIYAQQGQIFEWKGLQEEYVRIDARGQE